MRPWLAAALLCPALALAGACAGHPGAGTLPWPRPGRAGDAPYDLAEDQDLSMLRGDFAALPDAGSARTEMRRRLADEYAGRMERALDAGQLDQGYHDLRMLLGLWSAAELTHPAGVGAELRRYHRQLLLARARFARAGRDVEATCALAALMLVEPAARARDRRAEIDQIFSFADDLAVADNGEGAERARPIHILEKLVQVLPTRWAVDRLVALYVARQHAVDSRFRRSGADLGMVRVHGQSVLQTAWRITSVLARAGRIAEAPAALAPVVGLGDDPDLRRRLTRALAAGASAPDWVVLAGRFRASRRATGDSGDSGDDDDDDDGPDLSPSTGDPGAALAIAREAIRRFPSSPAAQLAAAEAARLMDRDQLAIRYYRAGLSLDPHQADAAAAVAALYVTRIAELARTDRPHAAAAALQSFRRYYQGESHRLAAPLQPDLADADAAMGRGLVSLGQLEQARHYLEASLARRSTLDALESLGTIALKRDDDARAIQLFERAVAQPAPDPGGRYQQCRLQRLLALAYDRAGQAGKARTHYRAALAAWQALSQELDLPPAYMARALVEQGKILWRLGHHRTALAAFDAATGADADDSSDSADVVAFLIERDQYDQALDAYHRALVNHQVSGYFKVYMSLWITAEARRQGRPVDPIAHDFLAGRNGQLWCDDLARYAGGRIGEQQLESRATTRARRTELLYYLAVLGKGAADHPERTRRLLRGVVDSGMVMFFEYDMARRWLRLASAKPRGAPRRSAR